MAFYNGVTVLVDKGRATDVIYLDLSKVLDTVAHDFLVSKSETQGFDRWTAWWIRNWLDGHTQRAAVNNSMLKWRSVMTGIAHVLVLGLILFNILAGDTKSVIECTLRKFAGDNKLCGAVDTVKGRVAIQGDLDRLERRAHVNLMKFSKAKSQGPVHGLGQSQAQIQGGREWIENIPQEGLGGASW